MSVFRPLGVVPQVVDAYHRARTAWERAIYSERPGDLSQLREGDDYLQATFELSEAIQANGGRLEVGSTRYQLTPKGIEISRVWPAEPEPIM